MIIIQLGIIAFLVFVLCLIYYDEHKRRKLERKSAKLNRVWKSGSERRKSVRINTEIDVLYEVTNGKVVRKHNSISRNISMGGINLALEEKLFPGTAINMQLNVPNKPTPIFVQGKIVWVKEIPEKFIKRRDQRLFATGVQFTQVNPGDQAILQSFINEKIKSTPLPSPQQPT